MSRSITRCGACRHHIIDSFAAFVGVSIRPLPQSKISRPEISSIRSISYRPFSTSQYKFEQGNIATEQKSEPQNEETPVTTSSIPWYLQVQTPTPPTPPSRLQILEEIPPIPDDALPILQPMLTHLSTQIGLDNLTLLDLRSIHPPPALGSNLLMILGTARSYKHLNTSADRFCRWLRSKYKLAPFADGLLGRNEMKLKLRRKARRMRLAQSVGNTVAMGATENSDDGITTGWVCVNVGAVDEVEVYENDSQAEQNAVLSKKEQEQIGKDEEEYQNPRDDSGVIGFGTKDDRPRIVVQMFTEEKRVEMDLEGLWDFRVQRRERKEERLDDEFGLRSP